MRRCIAQKSSGGVFEVDESLVGLGDGGDDEFVGEVPGEAAGVSASVVGEPPVNELEADAGDADDLELGALFQAFQDVVGGGAFGGDQATLVDDQFAIEIVDAGIGDGAVRQGNGVGDQFGDEFGVVIAGLFGGDANGVAILGDFRAGAFIDGESLVGFLVGEAGNGDPGVANVARADGGDGMNFKNVGHT